VKADRSARIFKELTTKARYAERRADIEAWNKAHRWRKRGLAYQPVKFGISFTASHLNQAGALVLIYADGGVQLNHGGTEMGQGLHTKMRAVAAHELGVSVEGVRVMNTSTDKVPNTSATAASSGSDLNGQAVADACRQLIKRLRPLAAELLGAEESELHFEGGWVYRTKEARNAEGEEGARLAWSALTQEAYMRQISLSAEGFYRTPDIHYDREAGKGKPFHYFAYGGALVEVEVCGLTGEHRVTRVDILHDAGRSLIPSIDRGQVEGGFIQGLGWLTREELIFSDKGALRTHSPDTYKIPALGDAPRAFHVDLLSDADQDNVIHKSKAVGEPPFVGAIAVLGALRQAISAFRADKGGSKELERLHIPCTPEGVLRAIEGC
jgi:xanthine dehydrogenase large subunit